MAQLSMPNRLAAETSPYLLQHKNNPVDWRPWGEEAFALARSDDKPIFLSVGYSACHWCHVMAHESFEDEETARYLNEHFVSIKVDREERPDVDSIYMNAVQAISGSGGWPMSVFMLPDARPFFGGTYFPNTSRHGMPSFRQILERVVHAYKEQRAALERDASQVASAIARSVSLEASETAELSEATLQAAFQGIASQYDSRNGGFGPAPKFPPSMTIDLLLRLHHRYGWKHALEMATVTLDRMAMGGIHDQLGGGFHRYSTDERWLVPHFEKMLYDNALLVRAYVSAFQVTQKALYRQVAEHVIEYVRREMTSPEGAFYSSQDADSEGQEGKHFVWDRAEVEQALDGLDNANAVIDFWGLTAGSNFEGQSILWAPDEPATVCARHNVSPDELNVALSHARKRLLERRRRRVPPTTDTKVLAAWNGLMISALAQAGRTLDRDDYLSVGKKAAKFVLRHMREGGRLQRSFKDGQARFGPYLEDYAFLIESLVELYQSTFDGELLREAINLAEQMLDLFWDDESGFYDTARDHERLIGRPQELADNAIPSGTSSAVAALLKLAILADRPAWKEHAERTLVTLASPIAAYPTAFSYLACQLDFLLGNPHEIVLAGDLDSPSLKAMLNVVFKSYRPNQVVARSSDGSGLIDDIPWLQNRPAIDGKATAYVCRRYVCKLPVTTAPALASQLES